MCCKRHVLSEVNSSSRHSLYNQYTCSIVYPVEHQRLDSGSCLFVIHAVGPMSFINHSWYVLIVFDFIGEWSVLCMFGSYIQHRSDHVDFTSIESYNKHLGLVSIVPSSITYLVTNLWSRLYVFMCGWVSKHVQWSVIKRSLCGERYFLIYDLGSTFVITMTFSSLRTA